MLLDAWDILNFYLEKRPRLSEKSGKIIFNSKITGNNNYESSHNDDEETIDESIYSEKIEVSQKQTIKAMSPFTSHFESFINFVVNRYDKNEINCNFLNFFNNSIILADPITATYKCGKKIRKTKKKNFSSYNDPKPSKLKLN